MGTNFYLLSNHRKRHIGKRSMAGLYCWDCSITLCKGGNEAVHLGKSDWYDACPKCGKKQQKEDDKTLDTAAMRELGFTSPKQALRRLGISSCCSFRWAIKPEEYFRMNKRIPSRLMSLLEEHYNDTEDNVKSPIENEYGELFTVKEFLQVLADCPIRYFDSIGQKFS